MKLGDLGAAAAVSYSSKMFTSLVGTAYFVAPEILDEGNAYGNQVDIWSLGVMAIELAEYVPPYYELDWVSAMEAIQKRPPPALERPTEWSPEFSVFCGNA